MGIKSLEQYRYFLKDSVRLTIDFSRTDQYRGKDPPPIQKPPSGKQKRIDLVSRDRWKTVSSIPLAAAINNRRSHRVYKAEPLSLEELSFLLWVTQGVQRQVDHTTAYRTVPSAGCRHAFETYLCVLNTEELKPGIYRYLPLEHQLVSERSVENLEEKIVTAALGQPFLGKAPVTFVWTTVPSRMEWRYDVAAHKVIAIDAGHVCQNLYLGCEAISAGTCAVGAYNQELMDDLVGADGTEEFTIYLAPVGKI